jgi:ribosome-binding factor A
MKINYQKETKTNFQLRRASKLQKVLMDIFSKSSFNFGEKKVFVNVIYVDLSRDLLNAKAVVDAFGLNDVNKRELVKKLNRDFAKQIRTAVAQNLKTKFVPEIIFCCQEENKKTEKVLDLIERERLEYDD